MSRADGMTLAAAALLAGCSGNSTGLTIAGAMRVEVEVYKGPMAQTVLVQQRELDAILEETALGLDQFAETAKQTDSQHCSEEYKTGCKRLQMAYTDAYQLQMEACTILRTSLQIQDAENRLVGDNITGLDNNESYLDSSCYRGVGNESSISITESLINMQNKKAMIATMRGKVESDVSKLGASLKASAIRISNTNLGSVPEDHTIRRQLTDYTFLASEYANQLSSRTGTLQKMTAYSLEANLLPVSDYLRDARPSDFLYLYDWYEATEGDGPDSDAPTLNRMDRIRAAERLFADYYWEKTNEVHASGQGETRMAFIKDDIGNWDLKTFSNRPGKLLNAYTSVADAALEAAITAAGGGVFSAPDPGEAGRLTDLAHRVATGETYAQPTAGGLDAERLHARTVTRITRERDRLVTKEAVLKEQQAAAAQEDDAKLQKIKDAKAAAEKEKADAQARKTACPTQAHACDAAQLATLDTQIATATATITRLGEGQTAQETANKDAATKREAVLKEQREEAVATIRAALDDHQAIIAVLQEASLPVATPATEAVQ